MFRVAVVCAIVAACGGAATQRVHKPGDEYLVAIRIEGNAAISADDLLPGLALQRVVDNQRAIDDYSLQLDTARIATAYQKLGFFAVDVKARITKQGDAATIVFTVVEGKRATTRVELAGLPPDVRIADAREQIALADGAPFDYDSFDDAKVRLQRLLEDAGYAHVIVDGQVIADRAHALATIRFRFDPGSRAAFGTIEITGVTGMLAEAVEARLKFHTGDRYSTTSLEKTQAAIYGMGRFAAVRMVPDRDTDTAVVAVKIAVTEVSRNEITAGGGFGFDPLTYSVRGRLQYVRRGFLTPLTTLTSDARPEYALEKQNCGWDFWNCKRDFRGRLIAVLTQQDLLHTDVKGDVEGGVDYLTYEAYRRAGAHTRLGLAIPIDKQRVQLRVGWQYTFADFTEVYIDAASAAALEIDHSNHVGAYTGALILDLRDKPIETTRGVYAEVRGATGKAAGGDFDYNQLTSEARGFLPLGPVVIALRARLGTITGHVPATERYFGGGVSSHRGFPARQLSPTAPSPPAMDGSVTQLVIGGAGLLESSIELRSPAIEIRGLRFDSVLFIDGGNVTLAASDLNAWRQYWAPGVGLRWLTPIGPVGFDLAYRINRYGASDYLPGQRFTPTIAVGEAF